MNKTQSLAPDILHIVRDKGTEFPFTADEEDTPQKGSYLCRQCGLALFRTDTKFPSGCGWPSFDAEITNTVKKLPDRDGHRTEILCARCDAHLGHVFQGEGFTTKNTRHCVNSLSLDFVANPNVTDTEEAIFAAGCFWGVEYYLKQLPGVLKTEVGYTGGTKANPSYKAVCSGETGHLEAIRVIYDPKRLNFETLTKYFFEIHDPTQPDGQGPDRGEQYLSAVFYYDREQERIAHSLIAELKQQGYAVVTKLLPVTTFWPAEDYHQDYYTKTGKAPYCHTYVRRFTAVDHGKTDH